VPRGYVCDPQSHLTAGVRRSFKDFKALAKDVSEKIKRECPGVTWKDSFATLGRFAIVDIVEATDPKEVEKAAMNHSRLRTCVYRDVGCYAVEGISRRVVAAVKQQTPLFDLPP